MAASLQFMVEACKELSVWGAWVFLANYAKGRGDPGHKVSGSIRSTNIQSHRMVRPRLPWDMDFDLRQGPPTVFLATNPSVRSSTRRERIKALLELSLILIQ